MLVLHFAGAKTSIGVLQLPVAAQQTSNVLETGSQDIVAFASVRQNPQNTNNHDIRFIVVVKNIVKSTQ
jgi:hypothetical protein